MINNGEVGELLLSNRIREFILRYYRNKIIWDESVDNEIRSLLDFPHPILKNGYMFIVENIRNVSSEDWNEDIEELYGEDFFIENYYNFKNLYTDEGEMRIGDVFLYFGDRNIMLPKFPVDLLQEVKVLCEGLTFVNRCNKINADIRSSNNPNYALGTRLFADGFTIRVQRDIPDIHRRLQPYTNYSIVHTSAIVEDDVVVNGRPGISRQPYIIDSINWESGYGDKTKDLKYKPVFVASGEYTGYGLIVHQYKGGDVSILIRERGKIRFIKTSSYNTKKDFSTYKEFCSIKILSAEESIKVFGNQKLKESMVGNVYPYVDYLVEYECSKDNVERNVYEVKTSNKSTKFVESDCELVFPTEIKGYSPPKDRVIKKDDKVTLRDNKGLSVSKDEVLTVVKVEGCPDGNNKYSNREIATVRNIKGENFMVNSKKLKIT